MPTDALTTRTPINPPPACPVVVVEGACSARTPSPWGEAARPPADPLAALELAAAALPSGELPPADFARLLSVTRRCVDALAPTAERAHRAKLDASRPDGTPAAAPTPPARPAPPWGRIGFKDGAALLWCEAFALDTLGAMPPPEGCNPHPDLAVRVEAAASGLDPYRGPGIHTLGADCDAAVNRLDATRADGAEPASRRELAAAALDDAAALADDWQDRTRGRGPADRAAAFAAGLALAAARDPREGSALALALAAVPDTPAAGPVRLALGLPPEALAAALAVQVRAGCRRSLDAAASLAAGLPPDAVALALCNVVADADAVGWGEAVAGEVDAARARLAALAGGVR